MASRLARRHAQGLTALEMPEIVFALRSEGSPYVLLEAMIAKLPIVATAVGGVPEIVEEQIVNGRPVERLALLRVPAKK